MMLRSVCRTCLSGVFRIRNRLLNLIDPPVIVLIYHRVTTLSSDPQLLAVSPENFLNHMRYLKDNFPVLRFEDDWSNVKEPSVVITFDDGYADNVREALPVIDLVGVPATFFISTGDLGSIRELWWDDLERILLVEKEFPSTFQLQDKRFGRIWRTKDRAERIALYEEMHGLIKHIDIPCREDWFRQLRNWADIAEQGRETHRVMTIDELMRLAASELATIGAHTVSHAPLAMLSNDEQLREIVESKRKLEKMTGREVIVFSYPFGGKGDYSINTTRLCREAGFVKAASNFPGQVHSWTDPFQLPRHLVRNWNIDIFALEIKKFFVV